MQAKNFVGVIHLPSGFQVEILPKLDVPEKNLRALVMEMICALKNFAGKNFIAREISASEKFLSTCSTWKQQ